MESLLLLLAIPFVWAFVVRIIFKKTFTWKELGVQLAIASLFTLIAYWVAMSNNTGDVALIHGQVTQKIREEDQYEEAYECNCYSSCSGTGANRTCTRICSTCYRTVYTVDWYLRSTIGNISIDGKESYYSSVWKSKDPQLFTSAYIGEPCTKTDYFTNYVMAAEKSLFSTTHYTYVKPVPPYPRIYGIYKTNNVLGLTGKEGEQWNDKLREKLKTLGAKKQVNIILMVTRDKNPMYRYAVEKAWRGGKKNDVVVIVGAEGKNVIWADAFTFGKTMGNQLLVTKIRDSITEHKTLDIDIVDIVTGHVEKEFKRKPMADFEYLKDEIRLSTNQLIVILILQLLLNIGFSIYFIKNDPFGKPRYSYY